MRYVLLFCLCTVSSFAQNINIPDANFKSFLVANYDSSGDGEISEAEAAAVSGAMDCSSRSIADLTGISFFTELTELYCNSNQLTALPSLSALTRLTRLYCYKNQLTTLPSLGALTSLTRLYCYQNQLTTLPSLSAFSSLTHLNCSDNQLTALPDLSALTSLNFLICSDNQLTTLPSLSHTIMTYLDCSDNKLTTLPDLSTLACLAFLDCSSNQLTALLSVPFRLIHLDCSSNKLTTLPDLSIPSNLTILHCHMNQLTALPSLSANTGLTSLNCSSNQLTALPSLNAHTSLTVLDCSGNQLTALPSLNALTSLTQLPCSSNQLTELPSLNALTSLTYLNCSNNQLTALPSLNALTNLTILYCYSNQLTGLPNLSALTNLTGLVCSRNQLRAVPSLSALTKLIDLSFSVNQLTTLPSLSALTSLVYLHCASNQLTALPSLSALTSLAYLKCYNNQLTELPSLSALTSLSELYCYSNQLTALPSLSGLNNLTQLKCEQNRFTVDDCPDIHRTIAENLSEFTYNPQSDGTTLDCTCAPIITAQPATAAVPVGDPVSFSVSATGTSINYQWAKDGVPITGATALTYTISAPSLADRGNYSCTLENSCGTLETESAYLSFMKVSAPLELAASTGTMLEVPLRVEHLANEGFNTFDLTLTYDSQMLLFSELVTANTLTSDWFVYDSSSPGSLRVIGISSGQALDQEGTLLQLRFMESGTVTGACTFLHLRDVTFGARVPHTEDGQFCSCLKGDADGNGLIELNDAVQVMAAVNLPPDPIGLSCKDVDCDGQISAQDVGLIAQYILDQTTEFCTPSIQAKTTGDVQLTMEDRCLVGGQRFTLDLYTSQVIPEHQVQGYQFALSYDENKLHFDGYETEGTLSQEWMVGINDLEPGRFQLAAAHAVPLSGEGLLIRLRGIAWQSDGFSVLNWDEVLLGAGNLFAEGSPSTVSIEWNEPVEEAVLSILCPRQGQSGPKTVDVFDPNLCDSHQFSILGQPSEGSVSVAGQAFHFSAGDSLGVDGFSFSISDAGGLMIERNASVRILDASFFKAMEAWPALPLSGLIEAINHPESTADVGFFSVHP